MTSEISDALTKIFDSLKDVGDSMEATHEPLDRKELSHLNRIYILLGQTMSNHRYYSLGKDRDRDGH